MKPAQSKMKIIPKHYQKKLIPSIKTKNTPLLPNKQEKTSEQKHKQFPHAEEKLKPPQLKRFQNNRITNTNSRYKEYTNDSNTKYR